MDVSSCKVVEQESGQFVITHIDDVSTPCNRRLSMLLP